jgi:hypothetical protein
MNHMAWARPKMSHGGLSEAGILGREEKTRRIALAEAARTPVFSTRAPAGEPGPTSSNRRTHAATKTKDCTRIPLRLIG